MNKTNLLQKFAPLGVAAFGAISVTGIAFTPAQASTLGWDNGTSDFFSDVNPVPLDEFEVTFSPLNIALISNADGVFVPPFNPADAIVNPPYTTSTTATGIFRYVDGDINSGTYQVVSPGGITFEFSDFPTEAGGSMTSSGNVEATLVENTLFNYTRPTPASIDFGLQPGQGQILTVEGINYMGEVFLDDDFDFEDGALPAGGEYFAEVEFTPPGSSIPEPASILGILAVCGLGLSLKRKKQS